MSDGLNNADTAEGPAGTRTEGHVGSSKAALGHQLCRWGGRATPQAASPCAYKPDSPRQDNEPTSGHVPVKLQTGPQVRMQHEDAWLRLGHPRPRRAHVSPPPTVRLCPPLPLCSHSRFSSTSLVKSDAAAAPRCLPKMESTRLVGGGTGHRRQARSAPTLTP